MTIPEFLEKLRATPGPWELRGEALRTCAGDCPITAVEGHSRGSGRFIVAGRNVGLSDAHIDDIMHAADCAWIVDSDLQQLRLQLLAATVERAS